MIEGNGLRLIEKKLDELSYNRNLELFNRQMNAIANNYNLKVSKQERDFANKLKGMFREKKKRIYVGHLIKKGGKNYG